VDNQIDHDYILRVCSAIVTGNQHDAEALATNPASSILPVDLRTELLETVRQSPSAGLSRVVRLSFFLPAWAQYVGQRLILRSPRFGYWLLRKTKLHHRWF